MVMLVCSLRFIVEFVDVGCVDCLERDLELEVGTAVEDGLLRFHFFEVEDHLVHEAGKELLCLSVEIVHGGGGVIQLIGAVAGDGSC